MSRYHAKLIIKAFTATAFVLTASALATERASAEDIKIGMTKTSYHAPVYIALEKGYFAAEGLTAKVVFFDAAPPVAVAVVSGDLDFGDAGTSGSFFNLAGQGALRLIAGEAHDAPGFQFFAFVASNRAFAAGLRSYKDLAGHSVSVSQVGSPSHYTVGLLEEKYGIDPKSVRVLPLQSISNQVSALIGGQTDAAVIPATGVIPAIQREDVKLIGWTSDVVQWQTGSVFISTKTADGRRDTVERFLRAFRKGARAYYDAFTGPDGKRQDGPTAPEILAIIAKYIEQPVEQVRPGIAYIDRDARLDVQDILRQIAWYKSQGMVTAAVTGDAVIDKRYVVPLPER
jgi:NitT/TauT family transport system substrate-binding protein